MNAQTMQRPSSRVQGISRRVSRLSPAFRVIAIQQDASALYRTHFTKPAKLYPTVGKNELTIAKQTGGPLAQLMKHMEAEPAFAQPVAARVQSFADFLTESRRICMLVASHNEQVHDGTEDVAQQDAIAHRDNIDAVRKALTELEEALAAGRELAVAYRQQIEELEAAERAR